MTISDSSINHSKETIINFGNFTFRYESGVEAPGDATVEMSFSAEATIPEFLENVKRFLQANGYDLSNSSIQCVYNEK